MKKKYYLLIFLFIGLIFISSCAQQIPLETKESNEFIECSTNLDCNSYYKDVTSFELGAKIVCVNKENENLIGQFTDDLVEKYNIEIKAVNDEVDCRCINNICRFVLIGAPTPQG